MPDNSPPPSMADNLDDKFLMRFIITINEIYFYILRTENGTEVIVSANELEKIVELGRGAYGVVEEMLHRPTGLIFAVKVGGAFYSNLSIPNLNNPIENTLFFE
jgi:hypothetical protein